MKKQKERKPKAGSVKVTIYLKPTIFQWLESIRVGRGGDAVGITIPAIISEKLYAQLLAEQN